MSILCLVTHVLCVIALKLLSGFFEDKVWLFDEERLATLMLIC